MVPWLTGRREKTVEESIMELQQSVVTVLKEVQTTLDTVQHTLTAHSAHLQVLPSIVAYLALPKLYLTFPFHTLPYLSLPFITLT